jgi:hypothetical protein
MNFWLLLTATLPTSPSALRVRVWRALKATGAGTLRDGVLLLPSSAPSAQALWDIERSIRENGAEAHMLTVTARDEAQEQQFQALFDRTEAYKTLLQSIKETRGALARLPEAQLQKTVRSLEQQLREIQSSDFFPGKTADQATAALTALRQEMARHFSPGEPHPGMQAITREAVADFQGRTWATRQRPWVDRLATAWLIQRFIDKTPRFVWLKDPKKCPKSALGFDFDDARFTHVGDLVTFEVVAASFGLEDEPGLKALGDLVHYIDVGGIPVDEAAGVETIVRGLLTQHSNDDALLASALPVFDALHAAMKESR